MWSTIDNEWHLTMSKVKLAWMYSINQLKPTKGDGIIIAHTDTGWTKHPEIYPLPNYLDGDPRSFNFMDPRFPLNTEDDMQGAFKGHGTSTASVMISPEHHPKTSVVGPLKLPDYEAQMRAGVRVIGVAPEAKILPFRVTGSVMLAPSQAHLRAQMQIWGQVYLQSNSLLVSVTGSASIHASAKVDVLKTLGLSNQIGDLHNLAKAIDYISALSNSSKEIGVVSVSLGGPAGNRRLKRSLKQARRNGIIVCCAAAQFPEPPIIQKKLSARGFTVSFSLQVDIENPISHWPVYPGSYPHSIRVAGTFGLRGENNINTTDYKRPPGGFYGTDVDFTTPGFGIHTAAPFMNDDPIPKIEYNISRNGQGTSHSTAMTAGICALWLAHHGRDFLIEKYGRPLMMDAFRYCVEQTVITPTGWDSSKRGAGIINAEELLKDKYLPTYSVLKTYADNKGWPETAWGADIHGDNWGRVI